MDIIRSIVAGERDPKVLASYRQDGCAKNEEEIAKSLEGNYKTEHVFVLKQALELYDFYAEIADMLRTCFGLGRRDQISARRGACLRKKDVNGQHPS